LSAVVLFGFPIALIASARVIPIWSLFRRLADGAHAMSKNPRRAETTERIGRDFMR